MYVLVFLQQLKQAGPPHAAATSDQQQELMRVRAELEKKNVQYDEELCRRETLHSTELKGLKKELRDAEGQHLTLQKEILMLKDKLEKTRRERYMCDYTWAGICVISLHFKSHSFYFSYCQWWLQIIVQPLASVNLVDIIFIRIFVNIFWVMKTR